MALTLSELRRQRHVTQVEAAAAMGRPQNAVSRIERQTDIKLSTLAEFVSATGGALRVVASYPDAEFEVVLNA